MYAPKYTTLTFQELTVPNAERPNEGFVIPNVELPPLCSPQFKTGPPGDTAQVCSQFLADVLQNSKCVNLESLCVVTDKVAWVLYCDLVCLDYDGSVLDACVAALVASLSTGLRLLNILRIIFKMFNILQLLFRR